MKNPWTTIAGVATILLGVFAFCVLWLKTKDASAEVLTVLVAMLSTTITAGVGLIKAADDKQPTPPPPASPPAPPPAEQPPPPPAQ